ncbi:MAG: hypothetical protein HN929_05420 [Chloroflexi bacterium]|jgi:hypothetical protein|nr:hypothetical protein [Chloroflexota bacterium]
MTKKKPTKAELLEAQIRVEYEASLDDEMAKLYNQFIAFLSESRVPLYSTLVVLEIVKSEVLEQIKKKHGLT